MHQIFTAVVLGIVQGLTEFLPVSSTAHLILFPWALGWDDPLINSLSFDVSLHLGTLVAVVWFFRADWIRLTRAFFASLTNKGETTADQRLIWLIILASFPAGVLGLKFGHYVEDALRNPLIIAFTLAFVAIIMVIAEKTKGGTNTQMIDDIRPWSAIAIGFAQACALIPGVSRSGATITAGLFAGFKREDAARFSFLLSTPIIAGASLIKIHKLYAGIQSGESLAIIFGIIASAISGYLAIAFLINFVKKHPITVFAWYRIGLAAVIVAVYVGKG